VEGRSSSLLLRPARKSASASSALATRSTSSPPSQRYRPTVTFAASRASIRHSPPASSQRRSVATASASGSIPPVYR
jgi:hypothetical protein